MKNTDGDDALCSTATTAIIAKLYSILVMNKFIDSQWVMGVQKEPELVAIKKV